MLNFKHSRCVSALFLATASQFTIALPQFINEFHYDNAGPDVDEYVEIAGLSGSDLSGWRLDFYNGTNGQIYSSWGLSGIIDDEGQGWGALSFSGGGLQNGTKDGIALVDSVGSLIQFISYEGVLTGTEGAANGISSVDVGVAETTSTLIGTSLQLNGSGPGWQDFSWASAASSFGQLNAGQTFVQPSLPTTLPTTPPTTAQSVSEPHPLVLFLMGFAGLMARRLARR